MIENDIRQMLERRAGDVSPSPEAWTEIERRLDGEGDSDARVVPMPARPDRRLSPFLLAAAVLVALGVTAAVVAQPDGASRVDTTPATTPTTPAPAPAPVPSARPVIALWPATTPDGLQRLQQEADTVGRPDLIDPRAAAGQYLSDRFLDVKEKRVVFEVGEYRAGDAQSGEVPYVADGLPGTVSVRRTAGEGSIWFVVSLTHLRLPVELATYDNSWFTFVLRPTTAGRLDVELSGPNTNETANERGREVKAGELVARGIPFTDQGLAIARFRLTSPDGVVSLSEIGASAAARPPTETDYCKARYSIMGEKPSSYEGSAQHLVDIDLLLTVAPAEVAADLTTYRAFVDESIDPADAATQEPVNRPPVVRDALRRIDAHDQRVCRAWTGP